MMEPTENQICTALVEWAQYHNIFLIHIPNEGIRGKWGNAQQKKIGLIKGFPDYFIAHPMPKYGGMFLEIKKSGKKPTEDQADIMNKLHSKGYYVTWADNLDDAIEKITQYLSF